MISLQDFKAICRAIATYDDFPLMVNHFIEAIVRAFKVKGCSMLLLDEAENQLFHLRSHGVSEEYINKGRIFIDEKYSPFVSGKPVFIDDLQNDPRVKYPEAAAKEGFVSLVSFPIKFRETTIGLIRIYHDKPWILHDDDVSSFIVLTKLLGLVIEINGLTNFVDTIKTAVDRLPNRMLRQ